jgi:hypothetical protein
MTQRARSFWIAAAIAIVAALAAIRMQPSSSAARGDEASRDAAGATSITGAVMVHQALRFDISDRLDAEIPRDARSRAAPPGRRARRPTKPFPNTPSPPARARRASTRPGAARARLPS